MRAGPYELLEELGRGGMGVVHRARRADLDREFAVKTLLEADVPMRARFAREARAAARMAGHPHVVAVHDVGEDDDRPWMAMDLIQGRSLEDVLADEDAEPAAIARWLRDAARGIAHAHAQGVLHRDLKPANILIAADGRAVVTDFGLARLQQADADVQRLTRSGELLGTPAYMAPEQVRGEATDARTDVYGLGAALYEALAGRPPADGPTLHAVLGAALREDPPPPQQLRTGVPRDLAAVALQCLRKQPAERYASAAELADDLDRFLEGEPVRARPAAWRARTRLRAAAPWLAAAAIIATAGAGWWGVSRLGGDTAPGPPSAAELAAQRRRLLTERHLAVAQGAAEPLDRLLDARFGDSGHADPAADAAAVAAIATGVHRGEPAAASAAAWSRFAEALAGTDGARDALAALAARDDDDPYPELLMARFLYLEYSLHAEPPGFRMRGTKLEVLGAEEEPAAQRARRQQAADLLAAVAASPHGPGRVAGTEVSAFGTAAERLATGRFADARKAFLALLDDPVVGADARLLFGFACLHLGRYDEAVSALAPLAERGWGHARNYAALAWFGRATDAAGRGEDPTPLYERAIALYSENVELGLSIRSAAVNRASMRRFVAAHHAGRGLDPTPEFQRTTEELAALPAEHRTHPEIQMARGITLAMQAGYARQSGHDPLPLYAEAIPLLRDAVQATETAAFVRSNLAKAAYDYGRALQRARRPGARTAFEESAATFAAAIAVLPEDLALYAGRGNALRRLAEIEQAAGGDPRPILQRAVENYTAAMAIQRDYADLQAERGRLALELLGEQFARGAPANPDLLDRTVTDLEEYTARVPGATADIAHLGRAHRLRAFVAEQRGAPTRPHLEAALACYERAIAAEPGRWRIRFDRAVVLFDMDRVDDAAAELERIPEAQRAHPTVQQLAAMIAAARGGK